MRTSALGGGTLELTQKFQEVEGRVTRRNRVREGKGRLQGDTLHFQTRGDQQWQLQVAGDTLRAAGGNIPAALQGTPVFTRARGAGC